MAKFSPQTNYFETSQKLIKTYNISYWLIFVLSIVATIFKISMIINYLGVVAIVFLAILEGISQDFKLRAEKVRRKDFIDNSFGTNFVHDSSAEYYDNDEIEYGMKKSIINLFENSFFSFNVSKEMFRKGIAKNLVFIIIILLLSAYGFSRNQFAIPILQLFLSRYFLLKIINTYRFMNLVEESFNSLKNISEEIEINTKLSKIEVSFLTTLVDYEALIAESNIKLDSKIFKQLNDKLTEEWDSIKKKYMMGGKK
jgi:hypothetical protein